MCRLGPSMSYYNNAPRKYTQSDLRTTKTSTPMESFSASMRSSSPGGLKPVPLNLCHRSRGAGLQNSYPSRWLTASPARTRTYPRAAVCMCPTYRALPPWAGTYNVLRHVEQAHAERENGLLTMIAPQTTVVDVLTKAAPAHGNPRSIFVHR